MTESIKALHNEWRYSRAIVLSFLENVNEENLRKKFPRKNYNTILEQCNELYEIQQDYIDAIENKTMQFMGRNLHLDSAEDLIKELKKLDEKLEKYVESLSGREVVNWFGEEKNIHQHLCAMISHEMMHVGQMVAFCYTVEIDIPEYIVDEMSLEG